MPVGIRFSYLENAILGASKGRNREKYMFSHQIKSQGAIGYGPGEIPRLQSGFPP